MKLYRKGKRQLQPLDADIERMLVKKGWEPVEVAPSLTMDNTKAEIMAELDARGIEYNPRDTKETLYNQL